MSRVKPIKVDTRLTREAFKPGGITVEDALRRADASLETMRGSCEETIDQSLAEIDCRYGAAAGAMRAGEPFDALHGLASKIIDASIFAKATDIDKAARAMCQLSRLCEARGAWDWEAVEVHIDALKLLRAMGAALGQAKRDAVLDGLRQVTLKRVGDPETLSA
jgi:hypothetical protein